MQDYFKELNSEQSKLSFLTEQEWPSTLRTLEEAKDLLCALFVSSILTAKLVVSAVMLLMKMWSLMENTPTYLPPG